MSGGGGDSSTEILIDDRGLYTRIRREAGVEGEGNSVFFSPQNAGNYLCQNLSRT